MGFKSGFVCILGSPNVGKSTLMNAFVGQKVSIVTPRAQTTRNKITGILTRGEYQIIFLDTPGIHSPKNRLGEYMVRSAYGAAADVDLALLMVDAKAGLGERDKEIFFRIQNIPHQVLINKADLADEARLAQIKEELYALGAAEKDVHVISALTGAGLVAVEQEVAARLPEGPLYYPRDMVTDRPERFIAAEILREKALQNLREEVPHGVGVEIEKIQESETLTEVDALIYCEKSSHKGIILGKGGAMLKKIASEARYDMERLFGTKVFLQVYVKVQENWRNSLRILKELEYRD